MKNQTSSLYRVLAVLVGLIIIVYCCVTGHLLQVQAADDFKRIAHLFGIGLACFGFLLGGGFIYAGFRG